MKEFSVSMALVDFIPVICFAIGIIILQKDLYGKMSKYAFALFATGGYNIVIAGALKATYKLLYALKICDFTALNDMFFPTQSIGFLLAGVGILLLLLEKKNGEEKLCSIAPAVFSGTFLFVGLMVAGLGLIDTVLSILSVKVKKPFIIIFFALSFVCSLCMGYLSSRDFTEAIWNWIAELINVLGQGAFLAGAVLLHKNGLKDAKI